MDRSDIITLYADTVTYNEYGVAVKSRSAKQVYCDVESVTSTEFFEAGRQGLNPEYRFTMFGGDYDGESVVGYNGRLYSVYRTYRPRRGEDVELYVERQGGTNGTENTA